MYYSESFSTSTCARRIMSNLTSNQSTVNRPPMKFHPPKNFKLPKRSIGAQGKDQWSFLYGVVCHLLLASLWHFARLSILSCMHDSWIWKEIFNQYKKRCCFHHYRLYILEGSSYSLKRCMNSAYHLESTEAVETLPAQVQDIGELLDASIQSGKALHRSCWREFCRTCAT